MSSLVPSTLHVISTAHRRGAQVFAAQLDEWLTSNGHVTATVALGPGGEEAVDAKVLGERLGLGQLRRLRSAQADFDVALAHGSRGLTGCALSFSPQPFIYRNIGDPSHWQSGGLRARRVAFYIRRAARVLALWEGAARYFVDEFGIPRQRIDVVPNAVRSSAFAPATDQQRGQARALLGLHEERPVVAFLGALSAEKRAADAVAAVSRIPGVQLALAGEGPELATVQQAAARAEVDLVHLGVLPGSATLLHACDAVVLPSATEGMPGVLIEAGLCGVPVVATDVGAVRTVVLDGQTGILAPVGDVAALAAGVATVLASPTEMGAAATAHCQHFTFEHVGPQVQEALLAVD